MAHTMQNFHPGAGQHSAGPTRRRLAHLKNPETALRIVAAAEQIFAERGLAGARTGAIARAAHVNNALLYYYFRSKEELHRFVLEALLSQLRANVDEAVAGKPAARGARNLSRHARQRGEDVAA